MEHCKLRKLTVLSICGACVALVAAPSLGQGLMHLELASPPGGIPAEGTHWTELYPTFAHDHTQWVYRDNGDGQVTVGDEFNLDYPQTSWKIIWVGPTYHLRPASGGDLAYYEPAGVYGGTPVGEYWIQVAPTYAVLGSVDTWNDNDSSGNATVGDAIHFAQDPQGFLRVIEAIGFNIAVEPTEVPTESTTWGQVKAMFDR